MPYYIFCQIINQSKFPAEVQRNQNISALFTVAVRVGTTPPAHFIVINQVTVRVHVASCVSLRIILSHGNIFERASVRFPHSTTLCTSDTFLSKVTVTQSVSVVSVHFILAILGVVSVLFVRVLALETEGIVIPSTAITHADTREIVVSVALHSSTLPTVIGFTAQYRVLILHVVSSPVFVPLFTPVISEVKATVPLASFRV